MVSFESLSESRGLTCWSVSTDNWWDMCRELTFWEPLSTRLDVPCRLWHLAGVTLASSVTSMIDEWLNCQWCLDTVCTRLFYAFNKYFDVDFYVDFDNDVPLTVMSICHHHDHYHSLIRWQTDSEKTLLIACKWWLTECYAIVTCVIKFVWRCHNCTVSLVRLLKQMTRQLSLEGC